MKGIIGKKLGMTRVLQEDGTSVPVTVVQAGPCTVLCTRTQERDGYAAVQMGFGARKPHRTPKAVRGQCRAAGLQDSPPAVIREFRLDDGAEECEPGTTLTADIFAADEFVDVTGTTKGRGFQGVVKRYNFGGGRASHGGQWLRKPGSIGMCEFPGRVFKGRKMPGQMGNVRRTVQNLRVVDVKPEDNLLLIKGAIPGPNGRTVIVKESIKKRKATE